MHCSAGVPHPPSLVTRAAVSPYSGCLRVTYRNVPRPAGRGGGRGGVGHWELSLMGPCGGTDTRVSSGPIVIRLGVYWAPPRQISGSWYLRS